MTKDIVKDKINAQLTISCYEDEKERWTRVLVPKRKKISHVVREILNLEADRLERSRL